MDVPASVVSDRTSQQETASLGRLAAILEAVADGVTVSDRDGRLTYANAAAARVCGFDSVEEMLGAAPDEIRSRFTIYDEHGAPFPAERLPGHRVIAAGGVAASALMRVASHRTGEEWWALVRSSPLTGPAGDVEAVVNVWHDVTKERRREEHARSLSHASVTLASSLDFRQTLSSLAALLVPGFADWCSIQLLEDDQLVNVATAHADETKLAAAREYQRRYPPNPAAPGGGVWNVIRTGRAELYADFSDELLVQGARDPEHLALLRSVGMRSIVIAPIRTRERVVGTMSLISAESRRRFDEYDVALAEELGRRAGAAIENAQLYTAEREVRRQLEITAERAEEASRIKDEFLATVSHELRTPLNAILGWATILRQQRQEPSVAKAVEVIHRNAEAQGRIIEDILDVARIITGKVRLDARPTDLRNVVQSAIEVVMPSAEAKRIALAFDATEPRVLVADPDRLQQVVWNLLSNAVKFTHSGGRIDVAIREEESRLVLSVKDTGRGITESFLPFVFDRFKQADSSTTRPVGGLGLGLAIVRHIVELHGGDVRAESAGEGHGATFHVTLPVRAIASAVQPRRETPSTELLRPSRPRVEAALLGLRVLVVDDDLDARELLHAVLSHAGAEVTTAGSAVDALRKVAAVRPHVLVSDIGMPGEDGYALVRSVRALGGALGDTPAVALTAYTRNEDRAKALEAGFTAHVKKPVVPELLVGVLSDLARLHPQVEP